MNALSRLIVFIIRITLRQRLPCIAGVVEENVFNIGFTIFFVRIYLVTLKRDNTCSTHVCVCVVSALSIQMEFFYVYIKCTNCTRTPIAIFNWQINLLFFPFNTHSAVRRGCHLSGFRDALNFIRVEMELSCECVRVGLYFPLSLSFSSSSDQFE